VDSPSGLRKASRRYAGTVNADKTRIRMQEKPKTGRPKTEYDLNAIEAYGACRATFETMADVMGCCTKTISRLMANPDGEFSLAYKRGFAKTKNRLAQAQINYALAGNATLLIWLGKQYLGQSDTPVTDDDSEFELIDKWTES
jgi:hypothetical protein